MTSPDARVPQRFSSPEHRTCGTDTCFATFEVGAARDGEMRHCNRSGPGGGHAHRWDGAQWRVVTGKTEHGQG
jgi:hypothetical protein